MAIKLTILFLATSLVFANVVFANEGNDEGDHEHSGGNFDGHAGRGAFVGWTVVEPETTNRILFLNAEDYDNHEMLPGVGISRECATILDNWSWQVQMNGQRTRCPKGPFGALLMNFTDTTGSVKDSQGRSCGRIVGTNSGLRDPTDPSGHSEIDAMRREAFANPNNRFNTNLWGRLSVITSGASCPMDTTAELYAQVAFQLYSLSVEDLIKLNYTQVAMEPEDLMRRSATIFDSTVTTPTGLVKFINRAANIERYAWRNIAANRCPSGCSRPTAGALCVDDVPFDINSQPNIPDVGYKAPATMFHLS